MKNKLMDYILVCYFQSLKLIIMNYKKFSLITGFSVWLIGTLIFSLWGDKFFLTNNRLIMTLLYIGVIPLLYLIIYGLSRKYKLNKNEIVESTIYMAVPALILDAFVFRYYQLFFPRLEPFDANLLSSLVIWIYGIVLIVGLLLKAKTSTQ